jgi:hypothetical protein
VRAVKNWIEPRSNRTSEIIHKVPPSPKGLEPLGKRRNECGRSTGRDEGGSEYEKYFRRQSSAAAKVHVWSLKLLWSLDVGPWSFPSLLQKLVQQIIHRRLIRPRLICPLLIRCPTTAVQ